MGVFTMEKEYTSPVPREKLFKFLTKDYYELLPKVAKPILTVEHVDGHLMKINHDTGGQKDSMFQKLESVDEANFAYKFSIEKGTDFPEKVEKKSFDIKMFEGPNGGTVAKIIASFYYTGNVPPTEQELQPGEDKGFAVFKDIETYLCQTK